jgi:hypothetical protein
MPSGKATLLVQFSSGSPALLTRSSRTNWINRAAPLPLGAGTLLGMTNHGDVLSVGPDSSGVLFAQRNLLETGWDAPVFLEQGAALDMAVLPSGEALLALQDTIQNQLSVALLE